MQLNKLQQTLFILQKCADTVKRVHTALEEHREKTLVRSMFHFSHNLAYYVILEAVAFLDEYNNFFVHKHVEEMYQKRVLDLRKVLKPIVREIGRWSDLADYRNKVVAHGWRDEKLDNQLTLPHAVPYLVPRTAFEFQLLNDFIQHMIEIIRLEFSDEMTSALWIGFHGEGKVRKKVDYSDIKTRLQAMEDDMIAIARSLGKSYDFQVHGYHFDGDGQ